MLGLGQDLCKKIQIFISTRRLRLSKTYLLFIFCAIIFCFTSCKKYSEDGEFPWRTVEKRIEGTYILDRYIVNNIDSTSLIPPCNSFKSLPYTVADGHYYFKFKPFNSDGRKYVDGLDYPGDLGALWSLNGDKSVISIDYNGSKNYFPPFTKGRNILSPDWYSDDSWEIRKLTNKEFWIKMSVNNLTFEVHLTKVHSS